MSAPQTVEAAGECRWCGHAAGRSSGRLVHVATGGPYCDDGRHVAELPPIPATPRQAQCGLCLGWFAAAAAVDHWATCPGPPPLSAGDPSPPNTKRARR